MDQRIVSSYSKPGRRLIWTLGLYLILSLSLWGCGQETHDVPDLAEGPELTPDNVRAELLKIVDAQEEARNRLDSIVSLHGWDSEEVKEAVHREDMMDSANMARLDAYVDEYGWPGITEVGEEASMGAFLIVQHAGLEDQKQYLPLLLAEANEGGIHRSQVAMLEDRVLMRQEKPQTYGTQLWNDPATGELGLYPIEDSALVDERRASVGLGPLDQYLIDMGVLRDTAATQSDTAGE